MHGLPNRDANVRIGPLASANAMPGKVKPSAEERLIARHFRPLATHPGAFDLADDAAAITPPPGCDLVLTTDGVISGVHVFADDPPDLIARKALRMNLSDLAAKGATPLGFLLALSLPGRHEKRRGSPPLPAASAMTRSTMGVRCSVVTPTARLDRRRSPSRHSAPCRAARWYGARAPKPVTSWSSPAPSAMPRSASSCAGIARLAGDWHLTKAEAAQLVAALSAAAAAQRAGASDLAIRVGGD